MANIQRARAEDAAGIAEVIRNVWNTEIDVPYTQKLINNQKQLAWVAVAEEMVVGFVSSFLTTVQGGVRRWEVDLLAVNPEAQGQGLGVKLVEATTQDAKSYQVKFSRGLVRADNTYARRAFERAGYANTGQIYNLYLWQPRESEIELDSRSILTITPVDTLLYRGVWIEGLDAQFISDADRLRAVEVGRAIAAKEGRANAGALIPVGAKLPDVLMQAATLQGQYQWWRRV